jgi:acyl-CoA reductase-like NAD-dependent aldehyde dehydrogenase
MPCTTFTRTVASQQPVTVSLSISNAIYRLECGVVGVNGEVISTCAASSGRVKESGLGREGGTLGLSEYLETQVMSLGTYIV